MCISWYVIWKRIGLHLDMQCFKVIVILIQVIIIGFSLNDPCFLANWTLFYWNERVIENEKAFPESSFLILPKIFCKPLLRKKKLK